MILDYTKDLTLFTPYERKVIELLILEYCHGDLFKYLNDIDLDNVEIYWYNDRDPEVLGGFHYLSGNVIYINRLVHMRTNDENPPYHKIFLMVSEVFPTICHELYHYYQSKKYKLLYGLLQLPLIRELTIEPTAYMVSDNLYDNDDLTSCNIRHNVLLKKKYKFPDIWFDQIELNLINRSMCNESDEFKNDPSN